MLPHLKIAIVRY